MLVFSLKGLTSLSRFYFGDTSVPLLVSAVPLFISKLEASHSDEEISIAFPDEGACKRFGKMFAGFEVRLHYSARMQTAVGQTSCVCR